MKPRSTLLKVALLPVLALALVVGACSEDASEGALTAPRGAAFSRGGQTNYREVQSFVAAPLHASAEIGREGGLLRADQYFLLVPRNAVGGKTTFTMDVGSDGLVSLSAARTRADGSQVDVGVIGFREKLTLALYYGNSPEAAANAARLQVGWVQSNGGLVTVPSLVNTEYQVVYGQLSHFSQYNLLMPKDDE